LGALTISAQANAAAFQLYEIGAPILGTAAVGQAANTADASTAYFNPAGMAFLPTTEFMLGSQIVIPTVNFTTEADNAIPGDNGGNAGTLTPGMSVFLAYQLSPDFKCGVSVTTPYGGSLTYNDGFVGRYVVQTTLFYTINLNPSVAYRVNDWLGVAAGVSLEYMDLHQTVALPSPGLADGQLDIKADNYAAGFNAGVMFTPTSATKIGVAYRSQITHNLKGNLTFLRINPVPDIGTKIVMPQNVIASLSQDFSCGLTLLAEAGWANWSSMQDTILNLRNLAVVTPRHWRDTFRLGLGGQYPLTPSMTLQAGISYDSSPTSADLRLPDMPMDQQLRIGTGAILTVTDAVKLGFSYEYMNLGNADIKATTTNGLLSGSYDRNYSNTLQVSVNICA